ncbi:MAG: 50S ribosomal protein L30 [Magnetococcales bacterium]|nr:50S ribosomal protein L30 [Magnetococcales bacterium]
MSGEVKMVRVQQIRSVIGRPEKHRRVLRALGLTRIGRKRELADTPAVRGMLSEVRHLVAVED